MAKQIGHLGVTVSANTLGFQKGLQATSKDIAQFKSGVSALQGSLFLITGQTGFFAVEALRAASNISKFTAAAGGVTAALKSAGIAAAGFLTSLGPIGVALIAAAGAYEIFSRSVNKNLEATQERMQRFIDMAKGMDAAINARRENALLTGRTTEFDVRVSKLQDSGLSLDAARRTAEIEMDNERLRRGQQMNAEFQKKQFEKQDRIAGIFAERQHGIFEKSREDMRKERQRITELKKAREDAAKSALLSTGLAQPSQFETDPKIRAMLELTERIQALKSGEKIGADFGISSASFSGDAPTGEVIGQQREQAKTNEHLADIKKLEERLVRLIEKNGLGVTVGP